MNRLFPLLFLISMPLSSIGGEEAQVCPEPRPQVCTQEYAPVCANLADGSIKTYATGCMACGDLKVQSWIDGACEG